MSLPARSKPWTPEEDTLLRNLVSKHGKTNKWATIAVEANFGHDSGACEKRWATFANPKLDSFAFGGAAKAGAVEGHELTKTGKPGHGFGLNYYSNAA